MCAATAAASGKRVLVLDHAKKPAEKIRISGGGRCNFTNTRCSPAHFLSANPHFCKSALARYTPQHFIALVEKHGIAYHEKTLGQLFCDGSSQQIIDMLLAECAAASVDILLDTTITRIEAGYHLHTSQDNFTTPSLVIASGGLSIPKMGATSLGYDIAKQFNIPLTPTRAGLVPFTMDDGWLSRYKPLAGVAIPDVIVSCNKQTFREAMLITHRGLSGPVMLQISSYWQEGTTIHINMLPEADMLSLLKSARSHNPKQDIHTILSQHLPKRLAQSILDEQAISGRIADLSNASLEALTSHIHHWSLIPHDTEGYRTAEVTLGGVDTAALSSQTMECKAQSGLYFIGEIVDVTGHLGGHNFQWAWASGHAAGSHLTSVTA